VCAKRRPVAKFGEFDSWRTLFAANYGQGIYAHSAEGGEEAAQERHHQAQSHCGSEGDGSGFSHSHGRRR
jgi:hypothetical protein